MTHVTWNERKWSHRTATSIDPRRMERRKSHAEVKKTAGIFSLLDVEHRSQGGGGAFRESGGIGIFLGRSRGLNERV